MVGSRFCELSQNLVLIKTDLKGKISVDITSRESVQSFFKKYDFNWVISFSAFTDVDAAEKQRGQKGGSCWQINVEGAQNVVNACRKYQRKLIFISTDFVFDGTASAYSEDDLVGPNLDMVSWYGITKIEAERFIKGNLSTFLIIRIAYPYRGPFSHKDDIAKRILRLHSQKRLYPMFADQRITPTFIDDLAPAIALLINQDQRGIFHIVSPDPTTQYQFARKLIAVFGCDQKDIKKGNLRQFLKRADATPRPLKDILKADKITNLGFVPTNWRKGIEIIYEQSNGKLI